MIYITGDTHIPIDIHKLNLKNFPQQKELTKDDYVLICGDFGGVWDNSNEEKYWLKWLNSRKFTTLFIDGNHENHYILNKTYEIGNFCGGKVHRIMSSIFHLMRGQIFTISDNKIFVMGGASSHDKEHRKEGISWWKEELPSESEYDEAINNLTKHDWNIDYIVTHCAPDSIQDILSNKYYQHDKLTNFFEVVVKQKCKYDKWYFGHYHDDKEIDDKHICLYNKIVLI